MAVALVKLKPVTMGFKFCEIAMGEDWGNTILSRTSLGIGMDAE
jgi:hypothetical protein